MLIHTGKPYVKSNEAVDDSDDSDMEPAEEIMAMKVIS